MPRPLRTSGSVAGRFGQPSTVVVGVDHEGGQRAGRGAVRQGLVRGGPHRRRRHRRRLRVLRGRLGRELRQQPGRRRQRSATCGAPHRRSRSSCGGTCSTSTSIVTWQAGIRPTDEPVRRAMHDARAYEARQRLDDQWVRILDVDAALATRTYGPVDSTVVVAVDDPMFADNCGTLVAVASRCGTHRSRRRRRRGHRDAVRRLPRRRVVARPGSDRAAVNRERRAPRSPRRTVRGPTGTVLRHRLLTR